MIYDIFVCIIKRTVFAFVENTKIPTYMIRDKFRLFDYFLHWKVSCSSYNRKHKIGRRLGIRYTAHSWANFLAVKYITKMLSTHPVFYCSVKVCISLLHTQMDIIKGVYYTVGATMVYIKSSAYTCSV
jgi:hypothetical protein